MTEDTLKLKAFKELSDHFDLDSFPLETTNISNTEAITTKKDGTDTNYTNYHSNQGTYTLVGLGTLGIVMVGAIVYEKIFKRKKNQF